MSGRLLAVVIGGGALMFGSTPAGIWTTKAFQSWTDKDAQQILSNSPWAKEMPMPISGRPGETYLESGTSVTSSPTGALGNSANTTTGSNMSVAAVGSTGPAARNGPPVPATQTPSLVSATTGAPSPEPLLKVIWASASPVRLAVLRLRSHDNAPTDEQISKAQQEWPNYVIAVVGLPAPEANADAKALASGAFLRIHGRAPEVAMDSDYRKIGDSDVYFFRFPKAAFPVTIADHEVEFRMTMGKIEVKRKFDLSDMHYQGGLAL